VFLVRFPGYLYLCIELTAIGLYISNLPEFSWQDRMMATISGKVIPVLFISVSDTSKHVLEIDVESAWKALELEAGWSNEVEIKVYINPA
jgi:hypothetical protein